MAQPPIFLAEITLEEQAHDKILKRAKMEDELCEWFFQ